MLKRAIVVSETYRAKGMRSRVALDMHDAFILEVAHNEWNDALVLASTIMSSIAPENLTEQTSLPIHWVAQPNMEENRQTRLLRCVREYPVGGLSWRCRCIREMHQQRFAEQAWRVLK